jgi:hypothetical protein
MLRDQRRALETTIGELEDIERQAKDALLAKTDEKIAQAG